jgi:hypothetical protein
VTLQTSSPPLSATICAVLAEGFPALNPARRAGLSQLTGVVKL